MLNKPFTVLDLLDMEFTGQNVLNLKCIGGRKGLTRAITVMDTNRPGLALSGFFDAFVFDRIQLFGRGECAYLEKLRQDNRTDTIERLFAFGIPCCIFSYGQSPSSDFMAIAERVGCPILQTSLETAEFGRRLVRALSNVFAPKKTMHGVLLEVYGIGILLTGHSGVGKSECALELVVARARHRRDGSLGCTDVGSQPNVHAACPVRAGIVGIGKLYPVGDAADEVRRGYGATARNHFCDEERDALRTVVAVTLGARAGNGQGVVAHGGDAGHYVVAFLDGDGVVCAGGERSAVGIRHDGRHADV